MNSTSSIVIIGGGLSGLSLGYFLLKKGQQVCILEGSSRPGGRIHTVSGKNGTPLELGATWFSDVHINLLGLMDELGLVKYPQYSGGISLFQTKSFEPPKKFFIPDATSPSYRIAGGTHLLINTLMRKLGSECIHFNKKVSAVTASENGLMIEASGNSVYHADQAIVCTPPQLASGSIRFSPDLPQPISQILPTVQTWMAGAIKFTLEYDEPFWRREGYSGMLYSHAGIVAEMYDHTNFEEDKYGFTGFLNSGASGYTSDIRKELVLQQLAELLGAKMMQPTAYHDKVWNDEFVLHGNPVILRPHQNNGHATLQSSYMENRLHFCTTETATEFAGYMEGAVLAAKTVAARF